MMPSAFRQLALVRDVGDLDLLDDQERLERASAYRLGLLRHLAAIMQDRRFDAEVKLYRIAMHLHWGLSQGFEPCEEAYAVEASLAACIGVAEEDVERIHERYRRQRRRKHAAVRPLQGWEVPYDPPGSAP